MLIFTDILLIFYWYFTDIYWYYWYFDFTDISLLLIFTPFFRVTDISVFSPPHWYFTDIVISILVRDPHPHNSCDHMSLVYHLVHHAGKNEIVTPAAGSDRLCSFHRRLPPRTLIVVLDTFLVFVCYVVPLGLVYYI